ncbi:hypothetical protein ACFWPU_07605 [Streptomyces sp. NPDC058471]|uniref:hypothetical protein n=1 Tax=Streptomyces sp. NPDC058471 TaxID=3346516 RepID=UPI00364FF77F
MTNSRRNRITTVEGRQGALVRGQSPTRHESHLEPVNLTKPYVYGQSDPVSRPVVPEVKRRKRRSARDVVKSVLSRATRMVERPTDRSEGEPTVREQLTYARIVIDDMLLGLDASDVKEQDARSLLRTVEDIYAQVSGVEVIEAEEASAAAKGRASVPNEGP